MAFKIPARCGEYTATTGTGTVTTAGAGMQMQTFSAGVGTTNTCPYFLLSGDGVNWERGLGTVTVSGGVTTVARTTVVESSNSNAAISLVGNSFIFVCPPGDVANANGLLDQLFTNSDGTYSLKRLSGVWSMVAAGGSSSGLFNQVMSATPTTANTGLNTWLNQGSATETDVATGMALQGVASQDWQLVKKTAPATPYTISALIMPTMQLQNFVGTGIGFTDGTKLHIIHLQSNNNLIVSKWTNTTTFNANDVVLSSFTFSAGEPLWLRIKDDGTTVTFYHSFDGATWTSDFSVSRASGFLGSSGYTNVWFGINSNTPAASATLMSWTQA